VRWLALLLVPALVAAAPPKLKAGEEARIKFAIDRGEELFEIDRAAWVTTDDMVEKRGDDRSAGLIKGWVVEREAGAPHAYIVTYYTNDPGGRRALYVGHVRDNKVVSAALVPAEKPVALTQTQARLADAVEAARERSKFKPCTPANFNVTAVPPKVPSGPVEVYLLTAMVRSGEYPFGGHYRLEVGDKGRIRSSRKFTNACMNIPDGRGADGEQSVALGVTHLLDPVPTEIHVFMSIWLGKPIYVSAGNRVWEVAGPAIRLVSKI
jgi:hypothetical protein